MVSRGLAMAVFAFSIAAFIPCISAQTRKTMRIDEKSDGREVSMRLGETLEITLSENASTGFRWGIPEALKNNLAPALREREETVEAPAGPPGRSGERHLFFDAVQAGTAEIEIHYRRPWEKDKEPARRFKVRVVVAAKD